MQGNIGRTLQADKTYYPLMDIVKCICALLIVTIHFHFLPDAYPFSFLNIIVGDGIARIAVPYFFSASGFLLYRKIIQSTSFSEILKKYAQKNYLQFGIWYSLLLIFDCTTSHLWYMAALVPSAVISAYLIKKLPTRFLLAIISVLYLIGLLGDAYCFDAILHIPVLQFIRVIPALFSTTRNAVFMGIPFMAVGMLSAKYKCRIGNTLNLILFIVSMVFVVAELHFVNTYNSVVFSRNMYVFLLPATYFLLHLSTNCRIKSRPIYVDMRSFGVILYYSHLFIYGFIRRAFDTLHILNNDTAISFLLTIVCGGIVSFIIIKGSKKYPILKYLYC